MSALVSLLGMAALLGIAVLASSNRRAIRLRSVLGAFLVQAGLGAFVLFTPQGKAVLGALSGLVRAIIASGDKGITFLFGSPSRTRWASSSWSRFSPSSSSSLR